MLFALADVRAVLELFRQARRGPFTVMAYEFFSDRCLARVQAHRKLRSPFAETHPYHVLVEVEDAPGEGRSLDEKLEQWVALLFESGLVLDGDFGPNSGAGPRAVGPARRDQREPERNWAPSRMTSPCQSLGSTPSARSSTWSSPRARYPARREVSCWARGRR